MDRPPVVFAMVLVWDSPPHHVESSRMVCALLPEQIDLGLIYNGELGPATTILFCEGTCPISEEQ